MKLISYCWNIFVNIFTVYVIFFIINLSFNDFEDVVLSLLVLIYINVASFYSLWSWQKQKELFAFDEEFKKIRSLLDDDISELEIEQIKLAKEKFETQQVKFYINSGFSFVAFLLVILDLLGNL